MNQSFKRLAIFLAIKLVAYLGETRYRKSIVFESLPKRIRNLLLGSGGSLMVISISIISTEKVILRGKTLTLVVTNGLPD